MTLFVSRHIPAAAKPLAMMIAIAFVFPSFSQAQTAPEKNLPPTIVVTATRSAQNIRDVLSDATVITSEEIAQSGQSSLVELLQRQHGIEIAGNGGPGTSSLVYIRGADNKESIVLVDGVRIGSSTLGGATWASIPLGQIDHIEIVYGPLSSMYGADAIGGVIQIFTKKGNGAPRFNASVGYGGYATKSVEAGVSGSTEGDHRLNYAVSVAHEASSGFSATKPGNFSYNPDKDGYSKDSASGQFAFNVSKGHELGFTFLQSRLDAQFDSGASLYDARALQKLENYALYSTNQILPGWTSHLQMSQSADKSGTDTSAVASGKSQIDTTQTDISWQNNVAVGIDMLQVLFEQRKENVDSSSTAALIGQRITNSAAASYQLKRGDQLASISIRDDNSSQYGSTTTGSAGYGYRLTSALRTNVSYGTSFRAPTFNELYFPSFGVISNKPEQGKNAEAGLYYDDGTSQISAVYYHNRITDLLVTAAVCPVDVANHPFGCAYNVDKALLAGMSFGASTSLADLILRGALDLQDPRDETTNKTLNRRAKQHGSVALEYDIHGVKTGAEMVFSGKRFDDVANKNVLGGYGLLNLYASYAFAPDWSLFGRWNNATNKNYALARNYATAGSNVFVGVRYAMQ
jgi:vitamin B12 transporter